MVFCIVCDDWNVIIININNYFNVVGMVFENVINVILNFEIIFFLFIGKFYFFMVFKYIV